MPLEKHMGEVCMKTCLSLLKLINANLCVWCVLMCPQITNAYWELSMQIPKMSWCVCCVLVCPTVSRCVLMCPGVSELTKAEVYYSIVLSFIMSWCFLMVSSVSWDC
jgi:hypothetical protein